MHSSVKVISPRGRVLATEALLAPAYSGLTSTQCLTAGADTLFAAGDDVADRKEPRETQRARVLLVLTSLWLCRGLVVEAPEGGTSFRVGLAAYEAWLQDLQNASRMSALRRTVTAVRAESWREVLHATADVLDSMAVGRMRSRAGWLREAAEVARLQAETQLPVLMALPRRQPLAAACRVLEECLHSAARMTHVLADAAGSVTAFDPALWHALTISWQSDAGGVAQSSAGTTLEDLLYLARGGAAPLRVLALHALVPFQDPRVAALLATSRYELSPVIRAAAEYAFSEWTATHAPQAPR